MLDINELLKRAFKYIVEGVLVAIVGDKYWKTNEFNKWLKSHDAEIKSETVAVYAVLPFVATAISSGFASTGGLNLLTTAYDITAKGNSDVAGDITCENLTITYFKI